MDLAAHLHRIVDVEVVGGADIAPETLHLWLARERDHASA
jgi:hypothetical protein